MAFSKTLNAIMDERDSLKAQVTDLQAQLERAKTDASNLEKERDSLMTDVNVQALRIGQLQSEQLDRATEPRADTNARQTWAELEGELTSSRAEVERLRAGRDAANQNMEAVKRYVARLESLFGGAEVMALWLTHDTNEGRVRSAYDWLKRLENVQSINMSDERKEGE